MIVFRNFTAKDWLLFSGNAGMFLTSLLYITWWVLVFRPGAAASRFITTVLLIPAFITGIAAIVLFVIGVQIPAGVRRGIPSGIIFIAALLLYGILLIVSIYVFHRPVTSELFIMILWAAGELCAISALYASGRFAMSEVFALLFLILSATAAGFICYLQYYKLSGTASFVDGLIPLVSDAAVIVVFFVLHAFS
ncbi:MAG: hypothetical protein M0P01_14715 [Treponema sp.]|nr:hypothetical protein [Treponema sp.]